MTVDELIGNVTSFFERQDIVDQLLRQFPQALRAAHSYQDFQRDLKIIQIPDPIISSGTVLLSPAQLPRINKVLQVTGYTGYTSLVIGADTIYTGIDTDGNNYVNLNLGYSDKDYFGFTHSAGFLRLGQNITVKGVPATNKLLEVLSVVWPTWEYDEFSETYTTDSWIMQEFPILVQDLLTVHGARIAQSADMLASAMQSLRTSEQQFLNKFTGEMYGGQSIGSN